MRMRHNTAIRLLIACLTFTLAAGCPPAGGPPADASRLPLPESESEVDIFYHTLVDAAMERTGHTVKYDPSYAGIDYPCGDVPDNKGVCADVVVRAYRQVGIDLQKLVHEDMAANFSLYPKKWGANSTDRNIDHRRVLNLMTYFERKGQSLPITMDPDDYQPGDIVAWDLAKKDGNGLPHIGIVVNGKSWDRSRRLIVHNIGAGPKLDDYLFRWPLIGHYRYDAAEVAESTFCPPPPTPEGE